MSSRRENKEDGAENDPPPSPPPSLPASPTTHLLLDRLVTMETAPVMEGGMPENLDLEPSSAALFYTNNNTHTALFSFEELV